MPKGVYPRMPGIEKEQRQAMARLLGTPAPPSSALPLPAAERARLLEERLALLSRPAPRPVYSTDFYRFLTERVWTKDEARGGRVAQIPPYPFLPDLCDDLVTCRKLFIEKSRRVLATWIACTFDVWIAAGGQDPRWAVLKYARGNRQVFLCHQKFEDSNKYLRERVWFIIRQLEERAIRDVWPDFPRWQWKEGEITASNGSLITAVAQGSDQLRGFAATLLHLEELAFWEHAKPTIEGALPTLRGGGHVLAITTANAGTYADDLRSGRLRPLME